MLQTIDGVAYLTQTHGSLAAQTSLAPLASLGFLPTGTMLRTHLISSERNSFPRTCRISWHDFAVIDLGEFRQPERTVFQINRLGGRTPASSSDVPGSVLPLPVALALRGGRGGARLGLVLHLETPSND